MITLAGADIELGNFILGGDRPAGSAREAARALLREIPGMPAYAGGARGNATGFDAQDWGRKFLPSNSSSFYIDLDHLECCLPEVASARDHVAAWHAVLRIAGRALADANAKLPAGQTIQLLANNSDGHSHFYGSHLDFLVTRKLWNNLFERKLHHLLFLASFFASSIVITGAGKVGAENGRPDVEYQLSQRADAFETLVGSQTTYHRPIVNSRDEPLCGVPRAGASDGPAAELARLHVICVDNTICHGSSLLKVATIQLMIGLLEDERVDTALILDDPVLALARWSHDPTLTARARLTSGRSVTAVELQLMFLEAAQRHAERDGFAGVVADAPAMLALWEDTLLRLRAGDVASLVGRLDWVLKRHLLESAMARRPDLTWSDPELKHLDHLYASLDPASGLYWACEQAGMVERFVSEAEIARLVDAPPEDTRAWGRAMLLRIAGRHVEEIDWDRIRFRLPGRDGWPRVRTVDLDDPLGFTRARMEPLIARARSLDDLLDALGAPPATYETAPMLSLVSSAAAMDGAASAAPMDGAAYPIKETRQ